MKRGIFFLGQIIFLITTEVSTHGEELKLTVITEEHEELSLKWAEAATFVANENLPIWQHVVTEYVQLDRNMMSSIGEFRTYHDLERSSAIIVFEKWNCIYGIIDVRYFIQCLPLNRLHYAHVIGDSPYVTLQHNMPDHERPLDLSELSSRNRIDEPTSDVTPNNFNMLIKTFVNSIRPSTSWDNPCAIHKREQSQVVPSTSFADPPPINRPRLREIYEDQVITVYPEILLFIPEEIMSSMPQPYDVIMYYLIQFNAVAMLFAKLSTHNIRIHVNLAGIVIEARGIPFPPTSLFVGDRPSGSAVLQSTTEYIKKLKNIENTKFSRGSLFSEDSFDMFLLSTTDVWREQETNPGGFSTGVFNVMYNRRLNCHNIERKFLGSIVDVKNPVRFYVNAAREIAHLMTVKTDSSDRDLCNNGEQCHGIMQISNQHCPNCLTWSQKSINSFKQFLSENTNRCFLRNLPRSFHRFGYPTRSLIPADQCLCYGSMPNAEWTHLNGNPNEVCKKKLRCGVRYNPSVESFNSLLPVDGTPCNKNDDNQVCWKKKCVSTLVDIYRRS